MRFLLVLLVALSLTLAWQSSVIAAPSLSGVDVGHCAVFAAGEEGDKKKEGEEEEPDCE